MADQPEKPEFVAEAAAFYLRTGRADKAEPLLQQLLQSVDSPPSQVQWARRSLAAIWSRGSYSQFLSALKLLERNIGEAADRTADLRLQAQLFSGRAVVKHQRDALGILESLAADDRLAPADRRLLANLYDALKQPDKADAIWAALVEDNPREPSLIGASVGRLLTRGYVDAAAEGLKQLQRIAPDGPLSNELTAWADVLQGEPQSAVDRLRQRIDRAGDPEDKRN